MHSGLDREVRFEIIKQIGKIHTYPTGWSKELNLIAWNGGQPKYDIRDWDPDHEYMSRGITLHKREAAELFKLLVEEFDGYKQFDELGIDKDVLLRFLGE